MRYDDILSQHIDGGSPNLEENEPVLGVCGFNMNGQKGQSEEPGNTGSHTSSYFKPVS